MPLAGPADVDDAVAAAQRGVRDVAGLDAVRGAATSSFASPSSSSRRTDELARLSVLDNGMTFGIAEFNASSVVDYTRYYAGWADKIEGRVTSSPAHEPRARVHRARALRRRRDHHHVERSAGVGRDEGHPGARRREHGGDQAVGAHAVRHGALHGTRFVKLASPRAWSTCCRERPRPARRWSATRSCRRSASPEARRLPGASLPAARRA